MGVIGVPLSSQLPAAFWSPVRARPGSVCPMALVSAYLPAAKNHSLSRQIRPPSVASKVGLIVSSCSIVNGVGSVQLSFLRVVRKLPLNSLLPDLVSMLTTPPVKFPYSAEMPPVKTVVSSIASSM